MIEDGAVFNYVHKTDAYTYRVPTPPRIVIPPPQMTDDAIPDLRFSRPDFLPRDIVAYGPRISSNLQLDWTYERRRQAQMILPYLFLGPMTVAKDEAWLREQGITMVLGVRHKYAKLMDGALARVRELGIETQTVDVADSQQLVRVFPTTTKAINEHVLRTYQSTRSLGKVLVFCESGNDRSAGIVAAYLMEVHNDIDHIKAVQLCQAQRFCVNFDDTLKRLLQGYWDILCARRAVAADGTPAHSQGTSRDMAASVSSKHKRALERDEDDELMSGMDDDDLERFEGRESAPFIDLPFDLE